MTAVHSKYAPDWISLPDAAQRLGISWHVAYRLILTRTLEGQRLGGRWLVSPASLEAYERQAATASAGQGDGLGQN